VYGSPAVALLANPITTCESTVEVVISKIFPKEIVLLLFPIPLAGMVVILSYA
jgi:hypothetical protein